MSATQPPTHRDRFLAACRRQPLSGGPPGWVMRQAGRYLPEYRAIREGHDFLEMVHTPELAAEVTLQPIRRFGMDCAVIFSDILVPPAAMGLGVRFEEGRGPVMEPTVRSGADVDRLTTFDAEEATGFVRDAIRLVRADLGMERAILGFCGAPYTVASYVIEGGSSRNFENAKRLMFGEPAVFSRLLERIVEAQIPYLAMQVNAGADVLQIFDSWVGGLSAADYRRHVLPHTTRLISAAKENGVPVIHYGNGVGHLLEVLLETGADVLSIDWRVDPAEAIARTEGRVALQGNMDPCVLFAPPDVVRRETERVLDAFSDAPGYIFNLGSGILPKTPVVSMETVFEVLKERR
ncbi:MAG: uroporphyrinogen decarboxylase [Gammaproteobacteria bacterium]|jgi:uroporphyrinogen decarboxylase